MKNRFRILFLASEVSPFAKTGGLADVTSSLPKALYDMGHDVRIIMPKYGIISERKYILREVIRLKKIPVRMGSKEHVTCAKSAFIPDSKVQVYFLDYPAYFSRPELYVDAKTGTDFPDNAERFMLLCRATLATTKLLHWQPQVIHCNDWQTAMIPWLLKHEYAQDPFFAGTATVLSVHNLSYQGSFDKSVLPRIGIGPEVNTSDLEIWDRINFLKSGLVTSDLITTVSPTYAEEIQTDMEQSAGLLDILRRRKNDIHGILNGVDYSVWNPEKDPFISPYDADNLSGKLENKKALTARAKLPFDEKTPIIGIVSRMVDQKGFDLIADVIDKLISLKVQLVVLGTGDERYHKFFKKAAKTNPNQIAAFLTFDEELAHLIEAGSDMFLMPSRFEPCGLNQMYSLRYGTVPIVRKTGGLADTIIDFVLEPEKGTGFVFTDYSSNAMLTAIHHAVTAFQDQKNWIKIQRRGMKVDFSWTQSAENYIKVYQKLESKKRK
ncbi:glycogen synthase GlgA [candidate division KSB1 bacterium]|nr:glycogen synthase GlgA [candidate division KSB1 bacterium]RQW10220.1 MAG: glycogen synthase GlgA [candidate division KSB1 bacterium]